MFIPSAKFKIFRSFVIWAVVVTFTTTFFTPVPQAFAQNLPLLNLPLPGTMVNLSPAFTPVLLRGLKVYPQEPLKFDFIVDTGNSGLKDKALEEESSKIIKYFLASLTVPEDDLWVNLSPYEKDRIIPESFGQTEMGRDMLAQDYVLKQLTASLMYPEKELGKNFWDRVYQKAREQFGTTEIPMNTFNKVWIVPEKAVVYENEETVFVTQARLKVMLEEDYLALQQDHGNVEASHDLPLQQIIRDILLPEIEREVNEGENFAQLRQIYHSLILAAWFKRALKENILNKVYVDQNKIEGVNVEDKDIKDKIYAQYLEAFKKGVYDYIKEDYDPIAQEIIPRKYFSGGLAFGQAMDNAIKRHRMPDSPGASRGLLRTITAKVIVGAMMLVGINFVQPGDVQAQSSAAESEQVTTTVLKNTRTKDQWMRMAMGDPGGVLSRRGILKGESYEQEICLRAAQELLSQEGPQTVLLYLHTYIDIPEARPIIETAFRQDPKGGLQLASVIFDHPWGIPLISWAAELYPEVILREAHFYREKGNDGKALLLKAAAQVYAADEQLPRSALRIVHIINDLHEESEEERFAIVESANAQVLYKLMVFGEEEIFTSSFNGLFNRLVAKMQQQQITGDQLLQSVDYRSFRNFIKMAVSYGRLTDFLATIPVNLREDLLIRFVQGVDKKSDGLSEVTSIIDAIQLLDQPEILESIQRTVRQEYQRVEEENNRKGIILYGMIAGVFVGRDFIGQEEWFQEMHAQYGMPALTTVIPAENLFNTEGIHVQQHFFYGDDNGELTFASFLEQFQGRPAWQIEDRQNYVVVKHKANGRTLEIYANKPGQESVGNEKIKTELKGRNLKPNVYVHRGHSYQADTTIEEIDPGALIVYLGSCGSYNRIRQVFERAPGVSIISTKGTGTWRVNEPLVKMLNDEIAQGHDIEWPKFWELLRSRLGNSNNFPAYIPPHENIAVQAAMAHERLMKRLNEPLLPENSDQIQQAPDPAALGEGSQQTQSPDRSAQAADPAALGDEQSSPNEDLALVPENQNMDRRHFMFLGGLGLLLTAAVTTTASRWLFNRHREDTAGTLKLRQLLDTLREKYKEVNGAKEYLKFMEEFSQKKTPASIEDYNPAPWNLFSNTKQESDYRRLANYTVFLITQGAPAELLGLISQEDINLIRAKDSKGLFPLFVSYFINSGVSMESLEALKDSGIPFAGVVNDILDQLGSEVNTLKSAKQIINKAINHAEDPRDVKKSLDALLAESTILPVIITTAAGKKQWQYRNPLAWRFFIFYMARYAYTYALRQVGISHRDVQQIENTLSGYTSIVWGQKKDRQGGARAFDIQLYWNWLTSVPEIFSTCIHETFHYLNRVDRTRDFLGQDYGDDIQWVFASAFGDMGYYAMVSSSPEEYASVINKKKLVARRETPHETHLHIRQIPLSKTASWSEVVEYIEQNKGAKIFLADEPPSSYDEGLQMAVYAAYHYAEAGLFLVKLYGTKHREFNFAKMEFAASILKNIFDQYSVSLPLLELEKKIIDYVRRHSIDQHITYAELQSAADQGSRELADQLALNKKMSKPKAVIKEASDHAVPADQGDAAAMGEGTKLTGVKRWLSMLGVALGLLPASALDSARAADEAFLRPSPTAAVMVDSTTHQPIPVIQASTPINITDDPELKKILAEAETLLAQGEIQKGLNKIYKALEEHPEWESVSDLRKIYARAYLESGFESERDGYFGNAGWDYAGALEYDPSLASQLSAEQLEIATLQQENRNDNDLYLANPELRKNQAYRDKSALIDIKIGRWLLSRGHAQEAGRQFYYASSFSKEVSRQLSDEERELAEAAAPLDPVKFALLPFFSIVVFVLGTLGIIKFVKWLRVREVKTLRAQIKAETDDQKVVKLAVRLIKLSRYGKDWDLWRMSSEDLESALNAGNSDFRYQEVNKRFKGRMKRLSEGMLRLLNSKKRVYDDLKLKHEIIDAFLQSSDGNVWHEWGVLDSLLKAFDDEESLEFIAQRIKKSKNSSSFISQLGEMAESASYPKAETPKDIIAKVLAKIGTEAAVAILLLKCGGELFAKNSPGSVEYLRGILAEPTMNVAMKQKAIEALGFIGPAAADAVPLIIGQFFPTTQEVVFSVLARIGSEPAMDFIVREGLRSTTTEVHLMSSKEATRNTALIALTRAPSVHVASVVPDLIAILEELSNKSYQDENANKTRNLVILALGQSKDLQALPYIRWRAEHSVSRAEASNAIEALGKFGAVNDLADIVKILDMDKQEKREKAMQVLIRTAGYENRGVFLDIINTFIRGISFNVSFATQSLMFQALGAYNNLGSRDTQEHREEFANFVQRLSPDLLDKLKRHAYVYSRNYTFEQLAILFPDTFEAAPEAMQALLGPDGRLRTLLAVEDFELSPVLNSALGARTVKEMLDEEAPLVKAYGRDAVEAGVRAFLGEPREASPDRDARKFNQRFSAMMALLTDGSVLSAKALKNILASNSCMHLLINGLLDEMMKKSKGRFSNYVEQIFSDDNKNNLSPGNAVKIDSTRGLLLENLAPSDNPRQDLFDFLTKKFLSGDLHLDSPITEGMMAEVIVQWSSHPAGTIILPAQLAEAIQAVSSGNMDVNNHAHLLANYMNLRRYIDQSPVRREISYHDFFKIIQTAQRAKGSPGEEDADIPQIDRLNIRGLVYEAFLMREKMLEAEQRAKQLGRKLVVVGNLSYGGVALAPITEEREGQTYIAGTEIPVWYTKVGSTESHTNEVVLVEDLFTSSQLKFLAEENPFVVVVDGTTSVADPTRTSAHIPDGFKGYRNFFMVLNYALRGRVNPADFYEDENFARELTETQAAKKLTTRIQDMSLRPRASSPYQFRFWYERHADPSSERDEFLYLRVKKQKDTPAPKVNISELNSPACIFMQSAIHPGDVDSSIQSQFIGGPHTSAYFDDKDHFKQFYLNYEEGYGVVPSKRYVYVARNIFREFMRSQGRALAVRTATHGKVRTVETVVLDLDGTLVKTAAVLENGTSALINGLLKEGKRVVIITDDIEVNVNGRLRGVNKVPGLVIFSDGGTKGYSFNPVGDKFYFDDYNARSRIDTTLRERILDIISTHFDQDTWQLEDRPGGISPDFRIELRNVLDRTGFLQRMQNLLREAGIDAKVYKVGRTTMRIVLQHKEHALKFFLEDAQLDESKVFIAADSARSYGIDRDLLASFPRAISVNVGSYSPSIARENPNIVQYDRGGVNTTVRLLSNILIDGGLREHLIVPSSQGQPLDQEESNAQLLDAAALGETQQTPGDPAAVGKRDPALERALLDKLYKNPINEKLLKIWIGGSLKELTEETVARWMDTLTINSAEYMYRNDDWGVEVILYRTALPNEDKMYFIVRKEHGKVVRIAVQKGSVYEYGALFEGARYYVLPVSFVDLVNSKLAVTTIQAKKGKGWVIAVSWIMTDEDKLQFETALNRDKNYLVKEFIFFMLERGLNPNVTGESLTLQQGGGAHYFGGSIYRGLLRASEVGSFAHEFIHAIYDKLTEPQRASVDAYFKREHPELDLLFETPLYKGGAHMGGSEGLAYYLQMALEGKKKNSFDGFDLVLKKADLNLFEELQLITADMKERIEKNLTDPAAGNNSIPADQRESDRTASIYLSEFIELNPEPYQPKDTSYGVSTDQDRFPELIPAFRAAIASWSNIQKQRRILFLGSGLSVEDGKPPPQVEEILKVFGTEEMKNVPIEFLVVDANKSVLNALSNLQVPKNVNLQIFQGEFQGIKYPKNSADIIISTASLFYAFNRLDDPEAKVELLVSIVEALRNEGSFLIDRISFSPLIGNHFANFSSDEELSTKIAEMLKGRTEAQVKTSGMIVNISSPAAIGSEAPGGIDVTGMDQILETQGQAVPIQFPALTPQNLEQIPFNGLTPVIINITPIQNLAPWLGVKTEDSPQSPENDLSLVR